MLKLFHAKKMLFLVVLWTFVNSGPGMLFAEEPLANSTEKNQLQKRIDFGNSYIMGQSIKSGAVYLMHRKKSDIKSMLKSRENYRSEILEDLKVKGTQQETEKNLNQNGQ